MPYPRVSLHIVTWNSMAFLPELLASVAEQTFTDFSVLIVDNASSDGAEAFVRAKYPTATFLRNPRNLGFAAAHNQAIRYALERWNGSDLASRYVLVTNPDAILSPGFLENIVAEADARREAGAFGGKLLRAFNERADEETLAETVRSERIDSTGIVARRDRTFAERGAGELDQGQYDGAREVFGVSGALALYRASALEDARVGDEFFDADFFAYKEDIDLSWRLRAAGHEIRFVPNAVAHHHRNMSEAEGKSLRERFRHMRKKSRARTYYSTRNHPWLLLKNEGAWNAILALPWMLKTEALRFAYVALFETRSLKAYAECLARVPKMLGKRRAFAPRRKTPASALRKWFV